MADPQTDVSTPSLDSLLSRVDQTSAGLADIKRQEISETGRLYGDLERKIDVGERRAEQAYRAEGIEPGELKKWDADEEAAKRRTDPITSFSSFGSVFGIIASAFTHAPMENALLASSAAMNAIKEGDEKSYDRAHKAWEENTKLALDRHRIQHEQYQDAISLLSTNMTAGQAKMRVLAAKYGDQKALFLLENGMDKELIETMEARQRMALGLAEAMPKITIENAKMSDLLHSGYDPRKPNSPDSMAAIEGWKQRWAPDRNLTPEQQAYADYRRARPDATPEEKAEYISKLRTHKALTPEQQAVNSYIEQHPDATAEELRDYIVNLRRESRGPSEAKVATDQAKQDEIARHNRAMEDIGSQKGDTAAARAAEWERHNKELERLKEKEIEKKGEGGATKLTVDRQISQAVARKKQELLDEGKTPEEAERGSIEYGRTLKQEATPPTSNRRDEIRSQIDRIKFAEKDIADVEHMMTKHSLITGLGGKATRPGEVVLNAIGLSSETDRREFVRKIEEIKMWLQPVLTGRQGRALAAEAERMNIIIAGLQAGDTKYGTVRAYTELRETLASVKKSLNDRYLGAPMTDEPPSGTGGSKRPRWMDAPAVQ